MASPPRMRDIVVLGAGAQIRAPKRSPSPDKVALISGGGTGHEPLHAGLVGHGHARTPPARGRCLRRRRQIKSSRRRPRWAARRGRSIHRQELRRRSS